MPVYKNDPHGEVEKFHDLIVEIEDGCMFFMHGGNHEKGWRLSFRDVGFTCPHGISVGIEVFDNMDEEGEE